VNDLAKGKSICTLPKDLTESHHIRIYLNRKNEASDSCNILASNC